MKKIGIAIKSTLQGSGEPIKVNPGPWDKRIVDIRDVLRHVPSLITDPNRSVVFVSFSDSGSYITVARCFQNREGDNIAGWIFIPNDILISGDEVCHVVDEVRNIIFMSELPERSKLDETFSKSYPLKPAPTPCKASPKNGKFAKREITTITPLNVLLGPAIYQPGYNNYQDIFITQFKDEVTDAVDITTQPLTQLVTLPPPTQEALAMAGQGVMIYLAKTNEPFGKPLMVPRGTHVELKAVRRGYAPEMFSVKVDGELSNCPLPQFMWKPSRGDMGVDAPNVPELPAWEVELANGEYGQIMIKGRGVNRNSSPLKGYELVGRKTLRYKPSGWTDRFVGFGAAILLGLIVCGILALCGTFSSHNKAENDIDMENVDQDGFGRADGNAELNGIEDAVKYLDNNQNWSKSDMTRYPELDGLFDDLNNFNFEAILGSWNEKLAQSKNFEKIVENAKICYDGHYPAKANKPGGKFVSDGSESISVTEYVYWINNECTKANQAAQSQPAVSVPAYEQGYAGDGSGLKVQRGTPKQPQKEVKKEVKKESTKEVNNNTAKKTTPSNSSSSKSEPESTITTNKKRGQVH